MTQPITVEADLGVTGVAASAGFTVYNYPAYTVFYARALSASAGTIRQVGASDTPPKTLYVGTFPGDPAATYPYYFDDGAGAGVWGMKNPGASIAAILPSADHDGTFGAGSTATALKLDPADATANALPDATSNQALLVVRGTGKGQTIPIARLSGTAPNRVAVPASGFAVNPAPDATSDYAWEAGAASGGGMALGQVLNPPRALDGVPDAQLTVNDALHCAVSAQAGQETEIGLAYKIMTPSGTVLRTFQLDDPDVPTKRT